MKKIFITSLALILALSITATSSYARNLQQHKTAAFSVKPAAFVADRAHYNTIRNRLRYHGSSSWVHHPYNRYQYRNRYWHVKKAWVPPKRNRVWKSGYRTSIGHWVPGKWVTTNARPAFRAQNYRVWISPR